MKILIIGGYGYIGSRVYQHLTEKQYSCSCVDLNWFNVPEFLPYFKTDYKNFSEETIQNFDVIIFLAGHSSVSSCENSPKESLLNNCVNFFHFVEKTNNYQKIIYASSASVYGKTEDKCSEYDELQLPIKEYDRQKQLIDYFMESSGKNYFGLRFGTVCGYSLNPRNELLINSIVRSAKKDNKIYIENSQCSRAVLGLNDLCRAVHAIIEKKVDPGFYNLASFNTGMANVGQEIFNLVKCQSILISGGKNTYSFKLNTSKFQKNFDFKFEDTLETIVKESLMNDFSITR